jgi:endonuclease/exonuclease/phosphatase family metal-dependent hydrolase
VIDRREFLMASGALAAATLAQPAGADEVKPGLRTITYNVLACNGYPRVRANKERLTRAGNQMATRFALELGLYEPDIVSFQEAPTEETVASIAEQMGMRYTYFAPGISSFKGYPIGFPGAIIARYDILEAENCPLIRGPRPEDLFTRHWGRAVLQTDTEELTFFSAHLHPSSADIRAREITEVLAVMERDMRSDRSFLFQGDLNHRPTGPEYKRWVGAGLTDTFAAKGVGQPFTSSSIRPRGRIDYIWAHGPIAGKLRECRVLFEGAFRTNPEDRQSFALSDHVPVMATFD